jgi:uncharacterized membrane protein (DUF2068 family)
MQTKQRHGCLTAWLILMMIGNALVSLVYFFIDPKLFPKGTAIELNKTTTILLGLLSLINLIFAIGLWFWKKWAFYGFAMTAGLMFFTNLNMGVDVLSSSTSFIGIMLLFYVLQIRQNGISGWENLE